MPTSSGNPALLTPNALGPSGLPVTDHNGIRTAIPIQKFSLTGAVKRQIETVSFGSGALLTASTAYTQLIIIPRNTLITAIYFVLTQAPTVATSSLTVTLNGVSLLAASFTVSNVTPIGTILTVPLSTVAAVAPPVSAGGAGVPYVTVAGGAGGFPYPILLTYTEGATTVHSSNVAAAVEYELDDFNG